MIETRQRRLGVGRHALWLCCRLLALATLVGPGARAQDSTYQSTLGPAVLCLSDLDPAYFHAFLGAIQPAYKREQGAYWFRISQPLFGAPMTEAFVSDDSDGHLFVGVVSSLPPDRLVDALAQTGAATFRQVVPGARYPTYRATSGAEIVHSGQRAKLFCRRDRPVR